MTISAEAERPLAHRRIRALLAADTSGALDAGDWAGSAAGGVAGAGGGGVAATGAGRRRRLRLRLRRAQLAAATRTGCWP